MYYGFKQQIQLLKQAGLNQSQNDYYSLKCNCHAPSYFTDTEAHVRYVLRDTS